MEGYFENPMFRFLEEYMLFLLALQLPVLFLSFFLFFYQLCPALRNVNRYLWFWKSLSMTDRGSEFNFFQFFRRYSCKNWFKNWYLQFHNSHDHQIWQERTSRGIESGESNQVGAGDVITSRLHNTLNTLYLYYQSVYDHQTWQDGDFPWWIPAYKVTWPFDEVVLRDLATNWSHYISTTTLFLVTKPGSMLTNLEGPLP